MQNGLELALIIVAVLPHEGQNKKPLDTNFKKEQQALQLKELKNKNNQNPQSPHKNSRIHQPR